MTAIAHGRTGTTRAAGEGHNLTDRQQSHRLGVVAGSVTDLGTQGLLVLVGVVVVAVFAAAVIRGAFLSPR